MSGPGHYFGECEICAVHFEIWPVANAMHGGITGVMLTEGCEHVAAWDQARVDKTFWDAFKEAHAGLG